MLSGVQWVRGERRPPSGRRSGHRVPSRLAMSASRD